MYQFIGSVLRSLGHFKGKERLSRLLLKPVIHTWKDIEVTGKWDCRYVLPNIIENVGFDIFTDAVFEADSLAFILSKLPQGANWLDIGANIGSICIPVCKRRPDVRAIAVEASPRVFGYLAKNHRLNDVKNLEIVNRALADTDDREVSFFSPEGKFGKGSLSDVFTQKSETVLTRSVDHLLQLHGNPSIAFIKIDVEGYEQLVFRGAGQLLSGESAPDILFEFIDWAENAAHGIEAGDAQDFLIGHGYRLYRFEKAGKLIPMPETQRKGYALIYASKNLEA